MDGKGSHGPETVGRHDDFGLGCCLADAIRSIGNDVDHILHHFRPFSARHVPGESPVVHEQQQMQFRGGKIEQ